MILRKVSQLEPGMRIRIPHPDSGTPADFNVRVVNPNGGPFGRWGVGFGSGDEEYGFNFFPDDLIEIVF